jgi:hypothetical protein
MKFETLDELAREVSDESIEFIDRILFSEYNHYQEKKQQGHDVDDELLKLEKAMDDLKHVEDSLTGVRDDKVSRTASAVEETLDSNEE